MIYKNGFFYIYKNDIMMYFRNIKASIVVILTTILLLSCNESKDKKAVISKDITTFYFIRHAEKDRSDSTNKNPSLTKEGIERADKWALYFEDKDIDLVYSTDYNRTRETATPLAKMRNLEITLYSPKGLISGNFIAINKGKNIVIVGHSNTTPFLVNTLLGKEKYENIVDDENNDLFIVTKKNNKTTATREKVN
ncbi:MAG: 2,3-bisphosphoglycerate-dependent phosphoglycerate mutase [Patiriisocius sp.]